MRLTVLGSGSAFEGGFNAATCLDGRLLVDCGSPVQVLLPRAGVDVRSIEAVVLTHFHADHTFMLPVLLGARTLVHEAEAPPLHIAGPLGVEEYVRRMVRVGYGSEYLAVVERLSPLRFHALQDGTEADVAGYRVRAHAVVHSTGPSLAYTIADASGTVAGFTGDARLCGGVRRVAAAAALTCCDCTYWDSDEGHGHMWRGDVERLLREVPGARLLLTHLGRRGRVEGALVAHDGLSLDIPAPGAALPAPPETLLAR